MLRAASPSSRCAVRTGCGKSQTAAESASLHEAGPEGRARTAPHAVRRPRAMRVQRFATLADIDASHPTVEEREEYEEPSAGHGHLRRRRLRGRSCGRPSRRPTSSSGTAATTTSRSSRRPARSSSPTRSGRVTSCSTTRARSNLRMADVVVMNKVDSAHPDDVATWSTTRDVDPTSSSPREVARSSPTGPTLRGSASCRRRRTALTHGEMRYGAGLIAARSIGAAKSSTRGPTPSAR